MNTKVPRPATPHGAPVNCQPNPQVFMQSDASTTLPTILLLCVEDNPDDVELMESATQGE